jgi:HKD family nuclease
MHYLSTTTDLLDWLHEQLPLAERFTAVSGFVSKSGIDLLREPLLELLGRGGRVHITTGVHEGQLTAGDAYAALTLFEPYPDTASLSVATDPDALLHAKTYVLDYPDGHRRAYVGSANLTAGGLRRNVEAGLLLDSDVDSEAVDALVTDVATRRAAATRVTREALPRLLPPPARVASSSRGLRLGRPPAAAGSRLFEDHLEDALTDLERVGTGEVTGVATGFVDLDGLTHGLRPGQMVVIGGRPGAGKTPWRSTWRDTQPWRTECRWPCSRWRWADRSSSCGSCRPRAVSRCTTCGPGR